MREAIAKLHAVGLVEVEANRYTRVASRNEDDYREASQLLAGYHELGEKWGVPLLSTTDRKALRKRLSQLIKRLSDGELDAVHDLLDTQGELVRASGSALFVRAEEPLRLRVEFLTQLDASKIDMVSFADRAAILGQVLAG